MLGIAPPAEPDARRRSSQALLDAAGRGARGARLGGVRPAARRAARRAASRSRTRATASAGATWSRPVADRRVRRVRATTSDPRGRRARRAGSRGSRPGGSRGPGPGRTAAWRPRAGRVARQPGRGRDGPRGLRVPRRPPRRAAAPPGPAVGRGPPGARPARAGPRSASKGGHGAKHGSGPRDHGAPGARHDRPDGDRGRRPGPPPYGARRDGPPAYGARRDGPPLRPAPRGPARRRPARPTARAGMARRAYGPRRDGPPPYGARRDGPPPYGPRRDGPPPYGARRDGPPYGQRREGPPRVRPAPRRPAAVRRAPRCPAAAGLPAHRSTPARPRRRRDRAVRVAGTGGRRRRRRPGVRRAPAAAAARDRARPAGARSAPVWGRAPPVRRSRAPAALRPTAVVRRRPVARARPRTRSSSPAAGPWRRRSSPAARRSGCSSSRSAATPSRSSSSTRRACASRSWRSRAARSRRSSGFDGHQGIALVVAPRRWSSPDEILALALERGEPALVVVLDSLEDPQNVGTLLRSAEATGVHGAVFPTHRQAPLTPAAVKASAGAVEHLRLAPVDDLPGALADLHARGLRIVGADGDAPLTARDADLRGPIAIVVGSEGRGLGPAVRRRCDLLVRIPMHGRIESLNAAVAGSILLYEAAAQRRVAESPLHPPGDDASADEVAPADDAGPGPGRARPRRAGPRGPPWPRTPSQSRRRPRSRGARRGRPRPARPLPTRNRRPTRAGAAPRRPRGRRRAPARGRRGGARRGLTHRAAARIIPRLAESDSCLTMRACRRSSIGRAAVL